MLYGCEILYSVDPWKEIAWKINLRIFVCREMCHYLLVNVNLFTCRGPDYDSGSCFRLLVYFIYVFCPISVFPDSIIKLAISLYKHFPTYHVASPSCLSGMPILWNFLHVIFGFLAYQLN